MPPPPPPPGLKKQAGGGAAGASQQQQQPPPETAQAGHKETSEKSSSARRPFWRSKDKAGSEARPQPDTPGHARGRGIPSDASNGFTPPPPPPPSAGGRGRGGRGRPGGAAAASTPITAPRPRQRRGSSGQFGTPPAHSGFSGAGSPSQFAPGSAPPRFGGSNRANGTLQGGSARKPGRRGAYYPEHLPGSLLQQGLKSGVLFRAVFRCNPGDRTQGYCTLPGLPTDVFVRGLKPQNRAVEGDEVAIRLLPPSDWYQLASSKAASNSPNNRAAKGAASPAVSAFANSTADSQPSPEPASAPAGHRSNIVPLPSRLRSATVAEPAVMMPPTAMGSQQRRPMGDLLASPALQPSASGGELGVAVGVTPLRGASQGAPEAADASSDESLEEASVSSEGGFAAEEEQMLAMEEEDVVGLQHDTDIAALMAADDAKLKIKEAPKAQADVHGQLRKPEQQQQQQTASPSHDEIGEAPVEQPESLAVFLVNEVRQLNIQPGSAGTTGTVGSQQGAADGTHLHAAPSTPSDPRLACWHPTGQPATALEAVAEQLRQKEGWRVTGEVVAILEPSRRREAVVGVLKQEGDKDTGVLFLVPCDPRMPRMMVRTSTLPHDVKQTLKAEAQDAELAARTLLSARVSGWEANFPFPLAQVRSSLGQAGDLATETAALLSMDAVQDDDQFTPEVLAGLPPTPWVISEQELGARRDLRDHRIFSIDPPTARDLDDALSVEELPGGAGFRVGVHIADVSHFVTPGSALDEEAQRRSTSVYLVDRVIPMLPRLLCEELCSLNPGVDRLAFSVVWDMTPEGDILSTWSGRTVIRSCGKLAYPHVQSMIEGRFLALDGQEPPCELHGSHTWPDVVKDSLTLHRIASSLRKRRFDSGALRLDNTRLYFRLDEDGNPCDYGVYEQREANQLVEEFMLLANMTTARMVAEAFPDRALLRCHPPPNAHKMAELSTVAKELGFELDTSGAGPLQRSLAALRASAATDRAALEVLTLLATKPMQNARYFCTGETPDDSFWRHFALAVPHYTHFTSPIRRYPDIIVHRLMAALLDQGGAPEQRIARHGLFPCDEVGVIAAHANDRKMAAKSVQDGSLRLYLCVMLYRQPLVCDAVVMQLGGSRFLDCYIPALGCDVRIHTNSLLAGGDAAISATWRPESKELELAHATADPQQRGEQDLPDYSDIPNLEALRNPAGVAPAELPLTLRMLCHMPILVSSRRSQTSGSPTHVTAKLWLAPLPQAGRQQQRQLGDGSGKGAAAAASEPGGQLREALAQGIQENWD